MPTSKLISKHRDVFMTSETFHFGMHPNGVLHLSFGAITVNLTFDAAHDLLFDLAGFISQIEEKENSESTDSVETGEFESIQTRPSTRLIRH